MRRALPIAALAVALLLAAGSLAYAKTHWHIVKRTSISGEYADASISATIKYPTRLAVRLVGGSGYILWDCLNGYHFSSWSRTWGPGLHQLRNVDGKDSCDVDASINGSGHLRVAILRAN